MIKLDKVSEFRQEAANAVFTKQQALAITVQLLKSELLDTSDQSSIKILNSAIEKVNLNYLDSNKTKTDVLLDTFNVARLTSQDILNAIEQIIFEQS